MTRYESRLPQVGHPLLVAWATDVGGHADHTPVAIGGLAVAAVETRLVGLDARTGALRWDHDLGGEVTALAGASGVAAAVVSHGEEVRMVALGADGEVRWEHSDGWQPGRGDLRGSGDRVIALGAVPGPDAEQTCRLLDAASGDVVAEVEVGARRPPFVVGDRLVYGLPGGGGGAGLYAVVPGGEPRRLHPTGCALLAIAGDVAVFTDREGAAAGLVAVDLDSAGELWRADAGPSSTLPADGDEVATTTVPATGMLAVVLREAAGGQPRWEGEAVEGRTAALTLTADLVLADLGAGALHVHDRRTGGLVQTMERSSALADGMCVTPAGVLDSRAGRIECLRGESR